MRRLLVSWPVRAITRRRLAAIGLSLCVTTIEGILVVWGLSIGAAVTHSGTSNANGTSARISVFSIAATAKPRAASRTAKAAPSLTPKPKLVAPGRPAAAHVAIDPDLAALQDEASLAAFEPLSGMHGSADPCSLAQDLATDLQINPFAQRAVENIPAQSLSVAGALLLWDGRWGAPDSADPGSTMLRSIILREVSAAKPECLAEVNPGPQFLFINGDDKTITIVIGSGQWRWGDLATSQ